LATFQSEIVKEILHAQTKLVIAADPDGLLSDEKIQQELREQGFEFITYDDPVVFRYEYESRFRSKWDVGENADRRVLLIPAARSLDSLPYDILQAGQQVALDLGAIFPELSYPILEKLGVEFLDNLYQTYHEVKPARMGDNETCDFILRHIFQITADLVKGPEDLLKTLLHIHFGKENLPPVLTERLLLLLQHKEAFETWPLKTLFYERDTFFQFLQERWPIFLDGISGNNETREPRMGYVLKVKGPPHLPLEDRDVRIYFDDLFLEGLLQPVVHGEAKMLAKSHKWVRVGLITGAQNEDLDNLGIFLESLKDAIPSDEARFHEWLNFASKWAHLNEMRYATHGLTGTDLEKQVNEYQQSVDAAFYKWLIQRYAGLYNMPSTEPVMQHHVPRALVEPCIEQGRRVALLVLDGMGFDQWFAIKRVLLQKIPSYKFDEGAIFAWAPTVTSVGRQALFSGKIPVNFASSILTTEKEPTLWAQFWLQQGLNIDACAYIKGLGEAGSLADVEEIAASHKVKALGLVVDKVDKIMHGMELGEAGMHSQVKQWASEGYLENLLGILRKNNFQIYLTADHGNIEASGCGRPMEGAISDMRGERVRIYKDAMLRSGVAGKFPGSVEWPAIGLPDNFMPLIAADRTAFILEGHTAVTHGGVCIEEIIVPLIQIDWRTS